MNQIIQLVPSGHLGCLSAWVIANGVMFKVPINVPRLFYINSRGCVPEEFPGRRVKKILPHSRPKYNLLEVSIRCLSLISITFLHLRTTKILFLKILNFRFCRYNYNLCIFVLIILLLIYLQYYNFVCFIYYFCII